MHFLMFFFNFWCFSGGEEFGILGGSPQEIAGNNTRNNSGNNIIILVMFVRRPSSWHGNYMHQETQNVKVNGIFYDYKWAQSLESEFTLLPDQSTLFEIVIV